MNARASSEPGRTVGSRPSRACREARPGPSLAGESSSFATPAGTRGETPRRVGAGARPPHVPRPVTISLPPEQDRPGTGSMRELPAAPTGSLATLGAGANRRLRRGDRLQVGVLEAPPRVRSSPPRAGGSRARPSRPRVRRVGQVCVNSGRLSGAAPMRLARFGRSARRSSDNVFSGALDNREHL